MKFTNLDSNATSVKVGLDPSQSSGLVEIIDDPDKNGVFKITDKDTQVFLTTVDGDIVNRNIRNVASGASNKGYQSVARGIGAAATLQHTAAGVENHSLSNLDALVGVAVEEVFVNIARYAGLRGKNYTTLRVEVSGEPVGVTITFVDHGVPYDPLAAAWAEAAMSPDEVENEAMGILMAKQLMDDIAYQYRDGRNILTLKKKL